MEGSHPLETLLPESENFNKNGGKRKKGLIFCTTTTKKEIIGSKVKYSIWLHCKGQKGREIYNTFVFEPKEHCTVFEKMIEKFD